MSEQQVEREIAQEVCERFHIATIGETDQICIYKEGKYYGSKSAESLVKKTINDIAGTIKIPKNEKGDTKPYSLSISRQKMIIDFVKSDTLSNLENFDSNERIINLKNGLYYLDGFMGSVFKALEEQPKPREITSEEFKFIQEKYPDPEEEIRRRTKTQLLGEPVPTLQYFITHEDYIKKYGYPYKSFIQIPVKYDPNAECLEIDQVFTDVFEFLRVPLIYEMTAYLILPTRKYSKAFMFYGETGTGKTTVLNIIYRFVGMENISGIELQNLDDKFELPKTRNKLVNIFDDLSSKPIRYVGNFKKLVTNTNMHGRIKFMQDEVQWKNRCKCIFACNVLPRPAKYITDAFYKRWVLIPCFNSMKEMGIEDTSIREKKYAESEMSGLFNKCVEAIRRLEKRKNFSEEWQDLEYVKNYWNMDINPVALFVEECCVLGDSYKVDYDSIFSELNKFRLEHRVREITKTMMTRSFTTLGIEKVDKGSKVDKQKRYYFKGIDFKPDYKSNNITFEQNENNLMNYNKEPEPKITNEILEMTEEEKEQEKGEKLEAIYQKDYSDPTPLM